MICLEPSALVSLFLTDRHSVTIRSWLERHDPPVAISTFAAAEFASAVSIALRVGRLAAANADRALRVFDIWAADKAATLDIDPADHRMAGSFVRRFDLALRAQDALHVALCRRLSLPIATFDQRQAVAAEALGVSCQALA